jgi:uncharacterized protein DUF5989
MPRIKHDRCGGGQSASRGRLTIGGTGAKSSPVPPAAHPSFAREVWDFLRVRKKWWLGPIVLVLVLFGALVVLTQGSAIAPFIYTIF